MPGVLELSEEVKISPPGERHTPDPKAHQMVLSKGPTEPPVSMEVRQEVPTPGLATPSSVLLGTLNHPRLHLRRPLELSISREGEFVVVSVLELEEFGYGPHLSAAIEDFRKSLIDLYHRLEGDQERLGLDLAELLAKLQQIIHVR